MVRQMADEAERKLALRSAGQRGPVAASLPRSGRGFTGMLAALSTRAVRPRPVLHRLRLVRTAR